MLDAFLRPRIDPPLNRIGGKLAAAGIGADAVTLAGLLLSLGAAAAVAAGWFWTALVLIILSRIADGLDGAVARATRPTDFGGYLDIFADFIFYAAVPLAFVWHDPANGLAAAALIASFYVNAASFLGFAVLAEKARMRSDARGRKSMYHSGGLLEGTETIAFFLAFCLFPAQFQILAWLFAVLTLLTAVLRVAQAARLFR